MSSIFLQLEFKIDLSTVIGLLLIYFFHIAERNGNRVVDLKVS